MIHVTEGAGLFLIFIISIYRWRSTLAGPISNIKERFGGVRFALRLLKSATRRHSTGAAVSASLMPSGQF